MKVMPRMLSVFLMLQMSEACVQKESVISIQWRLAGTLSDFSTAQSIGIAGPVSGIHNNTLIIGGGANFPEAMPWANGQKKYYSELYTFIKEAGTLKPQKDIFHLPMPVAYGANCSTPGGIVYAGGENENGLSNKVVLIQWDSIAKKIVISSLCDLPYAVANASMAYLGDKIYLFGGETSEGTTSEVLALDINDPSSLWQKMASLPQPVSHTVAVAYPENKSRHVYLIGGRKKNTTGVSTFSASVSKYNPEKNEWCAEKPLPYPLCAGTGVVSGNHILLFGGDKGETFLQVEKLLSAISREPDENRKQELIRQKNKLQVNHPGFSKEILVFNFIGYSRTALNSITFDVPVTTTAIKWGNDIVIPSGEIRAGVRTPQLLIGRISSLDNQ
jgi:N-acetylneuraminate epimerase